MSGTANNPMLFQWSTPLGVLQFSGRQIDTGWGRRVVARDRWGRDAAKQDDGGRTAETFTIETEWGATVAAIEQPNLVWPDDLNFFERTLRALGETGNLYLPTRGIRRAKLTNFRRVESRDAAGDQAASVTVTFVEDNEDTQAVTQWIAPSGKSKLPSLGSGLVTSSSQAGIALSGPGAPTVDELAAEVSAIASVPASAWTSDLAARCVQLDGQLRAAEATYTSRQDALGSLLTYPTALRAMVAIRELRAALARTVTDAGGISSPRIRTYRVPVSVLQVAAEAGLEPVAVIAANPHLAGCPLQIPAGTAIALPSATK